MDVLGWGVYWGGFGVELIGDKEKGLIYKGLKINGLGGLSVGAG